MDYIITNTGFRKLKEEIEKVKKELREISLSKGEAAETGGNVWHDNFAFEQLVQREMMFSKRLAELQERLSKARIVDDKEIGSQIDVRLGSKVVIKFEDGRQKEFTISDPEITDPSKGLISYQSPIGKALLGAKEGEERSYRVGDKIINIKVVKLV